MCVGRICPTKSKIPVVAVVATKRAHQKECTHDFFNRAPFPGFVHQTTAAPGTDVLFAKMYEAHKDPSGAGQVNYLSTLMQGIHRTLYATKIPVFPKTP